MFLDYHYEWIVGEEFSLPKQTFVCKFSVLHFLEQVTQHSGLLSLYGLPFFFSFTQLLLEGGVG